MRSRTAALLAVLAIAATPAAGHAQGSADCWPRPADVARGDSARLEAALARRTASAARLRGPSPRLDGRLDDDAWCAAAPLGDFVQTRPSPGAIATLPTVARVLFDDEAVYVAVRAFDPHPDSIVAPYPRRDDEVTSDWIFVEIDSRFDRRTGFSFGVNPRAVQADGAWNNDVGYEAPWNAVWEAATAIDSLGWTAEYRIPYSQLPFGQSAAGAPLTWGFNVYRTTPHRGETSNWSPRLPQVNGVISRFNELRGLEVPPRVSALEVVPYSSVAGARGPASPEEHVTTRLGGDLRFRPTPSTTVAASIHPDFGQVEADPSEINLTTFETYLQERRPLFVEGADVLLFDTALDWESRGTSFARESPFYSRRIGRAPRGSCPDGVAACDVPSATTLLGAVRASTRTANGWSAGLFHAWTGAEEASASGGAGTRRWLAEPTAAFTVVRAGRDAADGRASLGVIGTLVDRTAMRDGIDALLPRSALVGGSAGRLRFDRGRYEASAFVLASDVRGSAAAIDALRREPRHGYDRGASVDPEEGTHRALSGASAQAMLSRLDGRLQWTLAGRAVSRGFEANDVGFQRNADWLLAALKWKYERHRPGHRIRRWSVGSEQLGLGWTTAGARRAATVDATASLDLRSFQGGALSLRSELPSLDPEMLRGGPALLLPARHVVALTAHSDSRRRWLLSATAAAARAPANGSWEAKLSPELSGFVTDALQLSVAPAAGELREAWQYVGQPPDDVGARHYLVGALRQRTASLTARATYAFSARLAVQLYSQAFVSAGRYARFAEVVAPAARDAADRVAVLDASRLAWDGAARRWVVDGGRYSFDDPAWAARELHVNALVRWEWVPGSALFVVWTQQRSDDGVTDAALDADLRRLGRAPATNVLLAKVSWWLAR